MKADNTNAILAKAAADLLAHMESNTQPIGEQYANDSERFIAWATAQDSTDCRRWSYEIEAVALGSASIGDLGFNTHQDSSVTDDGCECDCGDCAHSCDCDHCDITNGYNELDHCGDCGDTEAAPTDSSPVVTTHDLGRLDEAMKRLNRSSAYIDDTCGGHIHIDASDLSAQQVATTMKLWRKVEELLPELIGRSSNHFAESMTDWDMAAITGEHKTAERYKAVNALNWLNYTEGGYNAKPTLEFRQFAGSLDMGTLVARGYLCRALVEHAKSGKAIYWLMSATSGKALLRELGIEI
jgi:hypothetical protein